MVFICLLRFSYGNHCAAYAPVCLIDRSPLLLFHARRALTFDETVSVSGWTEREILRSLLQYISSYNLIIEA